MNPIRLLLGAVLSYLGPYSLLLAIEHNLNRIEQTTKVMTGGGGGFGLVVKRVLTLSKGSSLTLKAPSPYFLSGEPLSRPLDLERDFLSL